MEEFYFVLKGAGRLRVGDKTLTVPRYGGVLVGPDPYPPPPHMTQAPVPNAGPSKQIPVRHSEGLGDLRCFTNGDCLGLQKHQTPKTHIPMKMKLESISLTLLAAALLAPAAFAGPSLPGGFFPSAKRGASTPVKASVPACCVTHEACSDRTCCTTTRRYSHQTSGRGLAWKDVRDCTKSCTMSKSDQRAICEKGKGM